jgi:hypothetical protein
MTKTKKKNPAASALAELSRRKRMATMTPEQRSAQGKRAVAARRDRQPKGQWYGLIVLPADYVWKGTEHAAKVLDEAESDSSSVRFWSTDRAEVVKRSQEPDLIDRDTFIIEQEWDPKAFRLIREYAPDARRQVRALNRVIDKKKGESHAR